MVQRVRGRNARQSEQGNFPFPSKFALFAVVLRSKMASINARLPAKQWSRNQLSHIFEKIKEFPKIRSGKRVSIFVSVCMCGNFPTRREIKGESKEQQQSKCQRCHVYRLSHVPVLPPRHTDRETNRRPKATPLFFFLFHRLPGRIHPVRKD